MDMLNSIISQKLGKKLFFSRTEIRKISKKEKEKLSNDLLVNLEDKIVYSNLHCTLVWIMKLLGVDSSVSSSIWKFMVDGRPRYAKGEVMVGLTPLSFGTSTQSCKYVFPLLIFPGEETDSNFEPYFTKIMSPILSNDGYTLKYNGKDHQTTWIHVSELKALWNLTGLKLGQCPFCTADNAIHRTAPNGSSKYHTWSRELDGILKNFNRKNIGICALHMKMRLVDMFMRIIARVVKSTPNEEKLRSVMDSICVPFKYYKKKKGDGWRLPSYKGYHADKIIENVVKIASCWPNQYQIIVCKMKRAELFEIFKNLVASNRIQQTKPNLTHYTNLELQKLINPFEEVSRAKQINVTTDKVVNMWKQIFELLKFINNDKKLPVKLDNLGVDSIGKLISKWYIIADNVIEDFVEIHCYKDATVYFHILLAHGLDLFNRFGPLCKISNQGFEAANQRDVKNFFSNTQRNGGNILSKEEKQFLSYAQQKERRISLSNQNLYFQPFISVLHQPPSKMRKVSSEDIVVINPVSIERKFNAITRNQLQEFYEEYDGLATRNVVYQDHQMKKIILHQKRNKKQNKMEKVHKKREIIIKNT